MSDTNNQTEAAVGGSSPTPCSASGFVVHDLTLRVEPRAFATRPEASKWLAHLMEWQPEARPVVVAASDLILEALKAGMACADNCKLNATYHKRTIQTALILFPQNVQGQ
jgi:hypothetical protein